MAAVPLLAPVARPVLVALVGLPGAGKSTVARRIARRFPLLVVESDEMRRVLTPEPDYSAEESTRLFGAIHRLIADLLARGVPVLLDATNLVESHREPLRRLAREAAARLVLVLVRAPPGLVRERLARRAGAGSPRAGSEADWSVYLRLRTTFEPIPGRHFTVETAGDTGPALDKIVEELEAGRARA
jgi:predicted kinase